ncbi:hypothetical protein [Kutzneria viridogrisea]
MSQPAKKAVASTASGTRTAGEFPQTESTVTMAVAIQTATHQSQVSSA